jgi:hypothetical protein
LKVLRCFSAIRCCLMLWLIMGREPSTQKSNDTLVLVIIQVIWSSYDEEILGAVDVNVPRRGPYNRSVRSAHQNYCMTLQTSQKNYCIMEVTSCPFGIWICDFSQ